MSMSNRACLQVMQIRSECCFYRERVFIYHSNRIVYVALKSLLTVQVCK